MHCKNTKDLLLFYGEHFYGFSESDLWKLQKDHSFHNKHIDIYRLGHRHFEVLWSFILYILWRFALSLKSDHYAYIPLYMNKTHPTSGDEKGQ